MDEKDKKNAYLENIIALLPGNIYWKDRRGKYLGSNDRFAKIVKLPNAKAIIGKTDYDLMSKELADHVYKTDQEIMTTGQEQVLEELGYDINDKPAIYLTKKEPLRDEKGEIIGIIGNSINITERKVADEQLHKINEQLEITNKIKTDFITNMTYMRNIIELLPGNIYWKDKEGRYLGCNENVANILKLDSPDDIIGKTNAELLGKDYADLLLPIDNEVIQSNQEKILEETGFDKDGNPAIYLTRKTPLYNEAGEVIGLLGVSLDISERKRYEAALAEAKERAEAASRVKSDFLAVISHELRIPLTGILGMAQLIESDNLHNEQREQLADLIKSGEHLLSLVNDLLDIAKLEAGKMELHYAPLDLRKILEEMTTIIGYQAKLKGLEMLIDYPLDIPSNVIADPRALRQILLNLTSNAIKFTEYGHIIIKVAVVEQKDLNITLAISVTDTGIGIPVNKLATIFDRFTQVDNSRTRRHGGTGLGLAIAKEYSEAMGGLLTVESEESVGTTFTCTIPFELASQKISANPWLNYQGSVRVLIIDDSLRGEVLRRQIGGSLTQVCDSKTALHYLLAAQQEKAPFDIVIVEQQLSFIDAFQFSREICQRDKLKQPMLLLLASKLNFPAQQAAKSAGYFDFLFKPIQPVEMLIQLTAAWEKWQEHKVAGKHALKTEMNRINILIVEDDSIIQRVHSLMLEKKNYHVEVADTGQQAIDLFTAKQYDIVLLDIGLPDINGFTVAKKMRLIEVGRGYTPIIGVTGYNSIEDIEKCKQAGMDEILIKPVKPEDLWDSISKILLK